MKKVFLIVFLLAVYLLQALDVSGKIVNEKNESLQNVIISCSNKMVISNKNGEFFLKDIKENDSIRIHLIGYSDQKYSVAELPSIIIFEQEFIAVSGYNINAPIGNSVFLANTEKITLKVDEKNNYNNAADIISDRADLSVAGTGLTGETQSVSVPGFEPRHTIVMLDGIPLNKSGEAFDIASIPAEIISTIEIGKSGGNSSIGTVINITTKQNINKALVSYKHTFGSFGLDKHSLNLNKIIKQYNLKIYLAKSYSRNDFKYRVPDEWNFPKTDYYRKLNDKEIYDVNLNFLNINKIVNVDYKILFQDYFKKLPGTINNPDFLKIAELTVEPGTIFLSFQNQ